ncbi:MAG: methionine--tRNA ligase subunit beta [Candidatus Lokiarchaeota archaeon]|nr:methionine--tRNA ligase subunit beta [Candidatus Lokiarchaeota archaeon]
MSLKTPNNPTKFNGEFNIFFCLILSMNEKKEIISYGEFLKLDIRIGLVVEAESIPKSRNLIKVMVDLGEEEPRQILAGMAQFFKPEEFVGKKVVVLTNLKPRKMMGLWSKGMILAADVGNKPYLLSLPPEVKEEVPVGSIVR